MSFKQTLTNLFGHNAVKKALIWVLVVAVAVGFRFLGAFLRLAAQTLRLTLVEQARKRFHRHRSEDPVHVDRKFDLPVGLGRKGVFALVVGIDFGPFGLCLLYTSPSPRDCS